MSDIDRWFPVARSEELVPRHIAHTQLLGQEIALWREDAGAVNAWENRCPHRGVRLSIGFNTGTELRCQYHGWRFAGGSGQCSHIPAHPNQKPASTIRVTPYGCAEQLGFVWANLDAAGTSALPVPSTLAAAPNPMTLRSVFVDASAAATAAALAEEFCAARIDDYIWVAPQLAEPLTFFLQPVGDRQACIHAVLHARPPAETRLAVLRRHQSLLAAVRDRVEGSAP